MISRRSVTLLLFACSLGFISFQLFPSSAAGVPSALIEPQGDPNANLSRGRALLKQGHADQALGYLETALSLFTQSNSSRGVAAAQDALGDLYLVQGQYKVALDHYRSAYEAFASASSKDQNDQAVAS